MADDSELSPGVVVGTVVALAVTVGGCWVGVHRLGAGWLALLVSVAAAGVAEWPLVFVHEAAHAFAAFAVGLPVMEFAVTANASTTRRTWAGIQVRLGMFGRRSHVRLGECSDRRTLATRMVVVFLAGPVANLLLAGLAGLAIGWAGPSVLVRAAILGVGVTSALAAVLILPIPGRILRFDGWEALCWLVRPVRMTRVQHDSEVNRAALSAWRANEPVDRLAVTRVMDSPDPAAAASAALVLLATADQPQRTELINDLGRLRSLALARGVPANLVVDLLVKVMDALIDRFIRNSDQHTRDQAAADVVALAETSLRLSPKRAEPRTALALAHLHQDQQTRARDVLRHADLSGTPATVRANLLAVWALVEATLDDLPQARQLIEQATQADPQARWIALVEQAIQATP